MNDKYKQLLNIYDEDNLRINIDGAAYYILLFEAFKDMVDSCVKFFYVNCKNKLHIFPNQTE